LLNIPYIKTDVEVPYLFINSEKQVNS
jgi:hypothetical protein